MKKQQIIDKINERTKWFFEKDVSHLPENYKRVSDVLDQNGFSCYTRAVRDLVSASHNIDLPEPRNLLKHGSVVKFDNTCYFVLDDSHNLNGLTIANNKFFEKRDTDQVPISRSEVEQPTEQEIIDFVERILEIDTSHADQYRNVIVNKLSDS
jgi:hypothetical protein